VVFGLRLLLVIWVPYLQGQPALNALTEVEITFTPEGTQATRVALEHRGFERLGKGAGDKLRQDVDGGWPDSLDSYAAEAARRAR
jgi:uncharacterized protein YndB with AHSA1/START domain